MSAANAGPGAGARTPCRKSCSSCGQQTGAGQRPPFLEMRKYAPFVRITYQVSIYRTSSRVSVPYAPAHRGV